MLLATFSTPPSRLLMEGRARPLMPEMGEGAERVYLALSTLSSSLHLQLLSLDLQEMALWCVLYRFKSLPLRQWGRSMPDVGRVCSVLGEVFLAHLWMTDRTSHPPVPFYP